MNNLKKLIALRRIRQNRIKWCAIFLLCFVIVFYLPLFFGTGAPEEILLVCVLNIIVETTLLIAWRNYLLIRHWIKWAEENPEAAKRCFRIPLIRRGGYTENTALRVAVINLLIAVIFLWR